MIMNKEMLLRGGGNGIYTCIKFISNYFYVFHKSLKKKDADEIPMRDNAL